MIGFAATVGEVLFNVVAGTIILGVFALLIVDALDGKTTWAGKLGALMFIPAGLAMGAGNVPVLIAALVAMAVLALVDRGLRRRGSSRGAT